MTTVTGKLTDMFKTVTGSKDYTVPAGGEVSVSGISFNIPAGYKSTGAAVGFYTGTTVVVPVRLSHNRMDVKNLANSSVSATATITVLCVKN